MKIAFCTVPVLFFLMFHSSQTLAQNSLSADLGTSVLSTKDTTQKLADKITNKGFGGFAVKFTSCKDHFAIMTGGRGACIINNRFTLGGAGYGIANSIPKWSNQGNQVNWA